MSEIYPQGDFILQQDCATSHTSRATKIFLIDKGVDYIAKDDWPPHSPDLNPMDYAMWDSLYEVYMGQSIPFTLNELKAKIKECWRQIGIEEVQKSIVTWHNRVRVVVQLEGGSTDHLKNGLH
ncbi:transposable element Tc3 transposase [Elysia marginata]|uniref:Transposable element Tc3 transposase n=1 Tax=Elysia marginata TaxID=1093978 RepID=A0AAV4I080_9GAST|nr:transposable element Tc3 transposase [Elysia marginata]